MESSSALTATSICEIALIAGVSATVISCAEQSARLRERCIAAGGSVIDAPTGEFHCIGKTMGRDS